LNRILNHILKCFQNRDCTVVLAAVEVAGSANFSICFDIFLQILLLCKYLV